jgi:hypothetical protein
VYDVIIERAKEGTKEEQNEKKCRDTHKSAQIPARIYLIDPSKR